MGGGGFICLFLGSSCVDSVRVGWAPVTDPRGRAARRGATRAGCVGVGRDVGCGGFDPGSCRGGARGQSHDGFFECSGSGLAISLQFLAPLVVVRLEWLRCPPGARRVGEA